MTDDRKRALDEAVRRNRARRLAPQWLADLSSHLGCGVGPDDLLSIDQTRRLRERFFGRVSDIAVEGTGRACAEGARLIWSGRLCPCAMSALELLARTVGEQTVVMFNSVDEVIGAVRVPVGRALAAAETLTDFAEMDLCLTTMSVECGLCFEQDRFGKLPRCELTVWGEWADALRFRGP